MVKTEDYLKCFRIDNIHTKKGLRELNKFLEESTNIFSVSVDNNNAYIFLKFLYVKFRKKRKNEKRP